MSSLEKAEMLISQFNYTEAIEELKDSSGFAAPKNIALNLLKLIKHLNLNTSLEVLILNCIKNLNGEDELICKLLISLSEKRELYINELITLSECYFELGHIIECHANLEVAIQKVIRCKYIGQLRLIKVLAKKCSYRFKASEQFEVSVLLNDQSEVKKGFENLANKNLLEYQNLQDLMRLKEFYYKDFFSYLSSKSDSALKAALIFYYNDVIPLLEIMRHLSVKRRYKLAKHIKCLNLYTYNTVELYYPELKSIFLSELFVSKKIINHDKVIPAFSEVLERDIKLIKKKYDYKQSIEEISVFNRLFKDSSKIYEMDDVLAFVHLGFFRCALSVLRSRVDLRNSYLECHLEFLLGEFTKVILEVNRIFEEAPSLENDLAFLYLKAEALDFSNLKDESQRIFKKILAIDSNYRDVKERVLNERS